MAYGVDVYGRPDYSQNDYGQPGRATSYDPYSTDNNAETKPPGERGPTGPSDPMGSAGSYNPMQPYATNPAYSQISNAYSQYLGRTPDYNELMQYWGYAVKNPSQVSDAIYKIQNSPEAKSYAIKLATAPPPTAPAAAPAAVTPYAAPTAPPSTPPKTDPFAAIGGGVQLADGSWVPSNHPLATSAPLMSTSSTTTTTGFKGTDPEFNALVSGTGIAPIASTSFTPPVENPYAAQMKTLMEAILANPQTMNPTAVDILKRQNIEEANSMFSELSDRTAQQAANRGMFNSGQRVEQERLGNEGLMNAIIRGNRGVDLAKAEQDRKDELSALAMADALASGDVSRFNDQYSTYMSGFGTTADAYTKANQLKLQKDIADLESALGWGRIASTDRATDIANNQFWGNLANQNEKMLIDIILGRY